MNFIKESKDAYKKVQEAIERETADHEISMARGECETIADRALAISAMLEGTPEDGNPLPAWVQSKITNACDYITTVHDYLKYNPKLNEAFESSFQKIYQMQQDGKTTEEIAKELKLKPDLVKKVLGEDMSNTKYPQHLLDLFKKIKEKEAAELAKRKQASNVKFKVTQVKVPGLENMAEDIANPGDKIADEAKRMGLDSYGYGRYGKNNMVTHRQVGGSLTKLDKPFKKEELEEGVDMSKVTKYKMISIKGDQKIITIDRSDLEKYLKQGYVIHEPITEEIVVDKPAILKSLQDRLKKLESDPDHGGKQDMIAYVKSKIKMLQSKKEEVEESFKDNIVKKIVKPIQDYNKKKEEPKKEEVELTELDSTRKRELKDRLNKLQYEKHFNHDANKEDLQKRIDALKKQIEAIKEEAELTEESDKGYNVKYKMKKDDSSISMSWYKDKELAQKFLDDVKKAGGNGIITAKEEAELKPVPSLEDSAKKHKVDIEVLKKQLEKGIKVEKEHTKDEKTAEKIALAHIDERPDYYIQIDKLEKKPVEKVDEACWTGYKQVGMKKKNGKQVPNCVPEETIKEQKRLYIESIVAVKNKAEKSGMPYSILKQVYDRGMAAWKGGHRPGATQVQWALARVNSFVTKSSGTWGGADSDLAKKVKGD